MRTLTATLTTAQKADRRRPYVEVKASNTRAGVVNLQWTRLYTGAEADSVHAATMPSDGSLIRIYASTAATNRKLYRQRVTSPGPASDFSSWTYLNLYGIMAVAACSLGAVVSLFWVKSNGEISRIKSTDKGATWAAVEYPGYAPSGAVAQMAAAYKPNGDLALFFTDADSLYVIRHTAGSWVTRATWNKTTGILSGVAAAYDSDWKLLVSGLDAAGNFKVWSLIYGDGGEVTAGTWSAALLTIAAAPSDGPYSFQGLFLGKPDVYRGTFSEIFKGVTAVNRPYCMNTVPATAYLSNRWREPVPFNMAAANGLAMVKSALYAWLTTPFSVWRASLVPTTLDLTADVLAVKNELKQNEGALEVELQNSGGQYSTLPAGLVHGAQISLSPGYQTPAGNEVSAGLVFTLQGYEHSHTPGKARVILLASDGWSDLSEWTARYQFRWNPPDIYGDPTTEASVKEILTQILARCGINLVVISESEDITALEALAAAWATKLLLHMEGTQNSTTFIDAATGKTVVANGAAHIDTAQHKFGAASAIFDGNGDYLSLASNPDWAFGTGAFTIDFWFRVTDVTRTNILFSHGGSNDGEGGVFAAAGNPNILAYFAAGWRITGTTLVSANVWHHVAAVGNGGATGSRTIKLYLDGVQEGITYTYDYNFTQKEVWIGANQSAPNECVLGWIDEFRISKGLALWTVNFTPPTVPAFSPLSVGCPDFTLQPGDNGKAAIKQLLSYVPDMIFLEGSTAYLVNPLAADAAAYSYGTDHVILEGRYGSGAWRKNRIVMEGYDPAAAAPVIVESYQWDEIYKMADRLERVDDLNIRSAAAAGSCGAARLREEEIEASVGYILSPTHCGQQLYDAIAITDPIAGLAAVKRRVLGISLAYEKQSAKYINKISLGGM